MALRIAGLANGRLTRALAAEYELVVRELLTGDDDLNVRFGLWDGEEDGALRVVCKVEAAAGDPLFDGPQWRWWSPLLAHPGDLRKALGEALGARRAAANAPALPAALPVPRHAQAATA